MARIRTIKPEFWTDSFMVQLPHFGRLFYIALWSAADDHGYVEDEPERIAMQLFPRENPIEVDDWIQFFIASNRVEQHVSPEGKMFLRISRWTAHQKVDKPGKSRIYREGSRKLAIPNEIRRELATKYGCPQGEEIAANCFYCGCEGKVHWHKLFNGKPSAWVTFPGFEIEHVIAEAEGGEGVTANLVLACRSCNRTKGTKSWVERLTGIREDSRGFANVREPSGTEGNREQGREQGKEGNASGVAAGFLMFWSTYPAHRRSNQALAGSLWHEAINTVHCQEDITADAAEDWLIKRARKFSKSKLGQSRFCPGCDKWLANARYFDADEVWDNGEGNDTGELRLMTDEEKSEWRPG